MLIFIRHNKYLSHFYKWVDIPDLFYDWQFVAVTRTMSKHPPTAFAKVDEKQVIDLDKLEVFTMP